MQNVPSAVIIAPPKLGDWMADEETGITLEKRLPDGKWGKFVSVYEAQKGKSYDVWACTNFETLKSIASQIKFLIEARQFTAAQEQALADLGFYDEASGVVNASERHNAIKSGTIPYKGNLLTAPWESARKDGLLPERDFGWDRNDNSSVYDYYNPNFLPADADAKAKKILDIIDIGYHWVAAGWPANSAVGPILENLPMCPLSIATAVCGGWFDKDPIPACDAPVIHATLVTAAEQGKFTEIGDSYPNYVRRLAWDYPIPWVIAGVVTPKQPAPVLPTVKYQFNRDLVFGQTSQDIILLQDLLKSLGLMNAKVKSTGYYGSITQTAVRAFQYKYQVASAAELARVNGRRVGPATRAKLNQLTK